MTHPRQYLYLMFIYLIIVGAVLAFLYPTLKSAFMVNWGFNLVIVGAFVIGAGINMLQVLQLEPEVSWIKKFRTGAMGLSVAQPPRLLNSLTNHLTGVHRNHFSLSALSLQTVLDGIRGRLDEAREISRYMISLLIFLGLLGTFWGLLRTIGDVGQIIGALEVGTDNIPLFFENLKQSLQKPLQGMGTAFSSSLFGLGGSLVLGFLDIQAGHAQNRFFNEMEEWLTGVTTLIDKDNEMDETIARNMSTDDSDIRLSMAALVEELRENNHKVGQLLQDQQRSAFRTDSDSQIKKDDS
ncbi:MAG: biopolymer transporter ExbB [Thermodesulfobacteriota bacterium]|nr:biopolymer transporter ExbB [Thermodesulfobacteriota bacterium]